MPPTRARLVSIGFPASLIEVLARFALRRP